MDQCGVSLALRGEREASKIEFLWEMFSSSASAFQLQSEKSHQLSLSPKEQERNKTLFKGCDLIELDCVRAFTPGTISVALSLCSAYCEAADNQIKN